MRGAGKAVQNAALVAFERAMAPELPAKEGFARALLVGPPSCRRDVAAGGEAGAAEHHRAVVDA